jgi:hypothetical protein
MRQDDCNGQGVIDHGSAQVIAATCSTVGMSAIGMPALAQAKTKIRVGYLHTLAVDGQIWLAEGDVDC